jgi:hypothetical protein
MRRTLEVSAVIAATILIAMGFHAWLTAHDEQLRMQATIATQKQQLDAADARERARATILDQTLAQIQKLKRDTQTPEEILKQLPQYLNLPEPITLNLSSTGDDSQAGAVSPTAVQGKIKKGTGLRVFGRNWFARNPTPANDGDERGSPNARNSPASAAPNSEGDSVSHEGVGSVRSETPSQPLPLSASADTSLSYQHDNPSKFSPASNTSAAFPDAANQSRAPASGDRTATRVSQNAPGSSPAQIPAADLKPLYDYVQDCRSCQAQLAAAHQNRADDAAKFEAMTRERDAAVIAAKGGTLWRRFRRNFEWFAMGAIIGATAGAAATIEANSTACHSSRCR